MLDFLFLFQTADGMEPEVVSESLFDVIVKMGPLGWFTFAILAVLSIIAVYIFIERWLTINKAGQIDEHFMNNIRAIGLSVF